MVTTAYSPAMRPLRAIWREVMCFMILLSLSLGTKNERISIRPSCRGRISAQQSLVLFRDRMVTNCLMQLFFTRDIIGGGRKFVNKKTKSYVILRNIRGNERRECMKKRDFLILGIIIVAAIVLGALCGRLVLNRVV